MKNIIYIFLIWILVISFSLNCQIHIYENSDIDIYFQEENILKRLNLFNKIHNNDFWHTTNSNKQKALKGEIDFLVKDQTFLKSFLKKAFVVSPENEKTVLNSLALRELHEDTKKHFRTLLYPNYEYRDEIKAFNEPHIVFPAGVTPYWSYDKNTNELTEQDEIGIIFGYEYYCENMVAGNYNNLNEEKLKKFIENIALCLVTAAYKLTKNQVNKQACQLKIPMFGLRQYSDDSEEKINQRAYLYVEAIYEALKKKNFNNLEWYVEFFKHSYGTNKTLCYENSYMRIIEQFQKEKNQEENNYIKNINITYCTEGNVFDKDTCIFNEKYMKQEVQNNYFTVFFYPDDPNSYLGTESNELKYRLIGLDNYHYLNVIHLLNILLPDIAFSKNKQAELTRLCNEENKKQFEENNSKKVNLSKEQSKLNLIQILKQQKKEELLIKRALIILGYIVVIGIITYLVKKFIIDIDKSSRIKNTYKLQART